MKKLYNLDIFLVILLTLISVISIFTHPLHEFPIRVIPCLLILFFLPGYALIAALYPHKENKWLIISLPLGIILSSALTFMLISLKLFNLADISQTIIFAILTAFTIIMALIALRRRKILKRYLKCKSCNGYYLLENGESLADFDKCTCGGKLEYAKPGYIPNKAKRKTTFTISKYHDFLVVVILTFITIVVLSVPYLCNSIIRTLIVPVLLFFLSGYALTTAIYPYKYTISVLKRILLSIGFSAVILFVSVFIVVYSFKTAPSNLFIYTLSISTVALILIAFIRRFKAPEIKKEKTEIVTRTSKISFISKLSLERFKKVESKSEVKKESSIKDFISSKKIESAITELISTKVKEKKEFKPNYRDLILIFIITILSIISVIVPVLNDSFIRTIFEYSFILFLSGYSLIAVLFPKINDLDNIERIALSFGLSIIIAPLIYLGLKLIPILISLSIFTISMLFIAFLRRKRVPENERFSVDFNGFFVGIKSSFNSENRTDKLLSIVLVASIILAISATAYVIVSPKEGEKFTEFYILGPNGKASDYPTNLTAGQTGNVIIGIVNHEYKDTNYKLVIKLNNKTLNEQKITLAKDQKYENKFNFSSTAGDKQKLEFLLYKLPDDNNVYRSLHLWINSK